MTQILNREFRDIAGADRYPFADNASMTSSDGLPIPESLFLDILLHVPKNMAITSRDATLPIYLESTYSADLGSATLRFTDTYGSFEATCTIFDVTEGIATAELSADGMRCGVLVYDPLSASALISEATSRRVVFGRNMPVCVSRCFIYTPTVLSSVKIASATPSTGRIFITAEAGAYFTDGASLNVRGETKPGAVPIQTINDLFLPNFWLTSAPDSGIRVETIGGAVKIRNIVDAQ